MSERRDPIDEIARLFDSYGRDHYGEGVSLAEHGLQCAALAEREGAPETLVAAALLHDVGHFLEQRDDAYGYHKHDRSGGDFLAGLFGPEVAEPVRLHVAAKRYLCAVDPAYHGRLSEASQYTLAKQGGPMSAAEVAAFEAQPGHAEAVQIRRWDDHGKDPTLTVPGFDHYRPLLEKLLLKKAA